MRDEAEKGEASLQGLKQDGCALPCRVGRSLLVPVVGFLPDKVDLAILFGS